MSLTELSQRLLFNSIVEVWVALCKDSGYDWQNKRAFNSFVTFIKNNNFEIKSLPVCPSGSGVKEQFEKKISILFGNPNSSFVLKTDQVTLNKLNNFEFDTI